MNRWTLSAVLCIGLAACAAFVGALQNDFVDWDDCPLLVDNEAYRGLSASHLGWMFTTALGGHYQPLTWLSFALEYRVCGLTTFSAHLVNLVLHVLTCVGVFAVARHLIRTASSLPESAVTVGAFAAALLFGLHPLRVESVAWVTARRDVLSAAWLMAATLLYLKALCLEHRQAQYAGRGQPLPHGRGSEKGVPDARIIRVDHALHRAAVTASAFPREGGGKGRALALHQASRRRALLCAATMFYVAALLSKAVGMTWPIVLILLDVFPLRRVGALALPERKITWPQCIWEKAGFLVAAALSSLTALWAQRSAGALWTWEAHPLSLRVAQAFFGIVFYLVKSVWPVRLLPLYEQPTDATALDVQYILAALTVVAVTGALFAIRRRVPAVWIAWLAYVVLLSPTLGLAQSGPQLVADRYTYLPSLAWTILLGAEIARLLSLISDPLPRRERGWSPRLALVAVVGAVLIVLGARTRAQVAVWKNTRTLWTHVLSLAPKTGLAHANLAVFLNNHGEFQSARQHAIRAVEILPGNRTAHLALATTSIELADLATAERHLVTALEIKPDDAGTWLKLAGVLKRQGKTDEAEKCYRRAWDPQSTGDSAIGP